MSSLELPLTRMSLIGLLQGKGEQARALNQARTEFYEIYCPVVLTWCLKCGLQQADAEEVTQEVVLKLFEAIRLYRPDKGLFRCWLKTVVNRAVVDSVRSTALRPHLLEAAQLDSLCSAGGVAALQEDLGDAWHPDLELAQEIVARVRARLSPHTWEAYYRLKVLGKETAAGVARDLGISVNSVYVAVNRVGEKLREEKDRFLESSRQ